MASDITPESLKEWRKEQKMTQTEMGSLMGWEKLVVTNIETGRRKISDAEQRLLKLLIHGELPFNAPVSDDVLEFDQDEWGLIHRMAQREGYSDAKDWIVSKIRAYLSMLPKQSEDIPAIEDLKPDPIPAIPGAASKPTYTLEEARRLAEAEAASRDDISEELYDQQQLENDRLYEEARKKKKGKQKSQKRFSA
ncbi:helix-turn-helix transcriptional regulator [Rubellicoccus peritrichatus]|uniref:Helix-turn-helix transcriptional regulator n=1 Tax=Rubellicoccus peritrichatus TaxID=3080537 RepID=A0AAQ3QUI0_9BACT|nr:helix-turn-helix transcriptional regulator [Puniceicoccus sp. CR14]WOO40409.1 helix-turn-helix transcriptional regulator [Puniceicoccus sp. CR14]WOO40458.1 helix-turn-helix transcriptional regulator [Puniceicoccus sp. CR14]WOO40507.1 helix-turn-helix transcriptional regulator [Puniceicoccus sp. CR14]WOO40557.1 helix-turn-helix transcriptional regulator [Puniceicoccus sp. CR14]